MKQFLHVLFVVSVLFVLSVPSSANVFNLGPGVTNLEMVTVGDPGNAGELSGAGAGGYGYNRICGSVSYTYDIGKYEVTAAQYADFLNKVADTDTYGLYNTNMWSGSYACKIQRSGNSGSYTYNVAADWANRPVNWVSFWDSVRFANWLHNGQPTGLQNAFTTEDGAYFINGYNGPDGRTISRKAGWQWAVTSEDEWYKAAYYKGGTSNAYWDYTTGSDTLPGRDMADVSGNNANHYSGAAPYPIDNGKYTTIVGEFQNSASHYGTFDQGGNIGEYNETLASSGSSYRGLRGGDFYGYGGSGSAWDRTLRASGRDYFSNPGSDYWEFGFRVSAVPEPSSLLILAGGLGILLGIRRRNC